MQQVERWRHIVQRASGWLKGLRPQSFSRAFYLILEAGLCPAFFY
jgi:hypothetical protein